MTPARAQKQAENALLQARRIVVKIGSALLVDEDSGNIRRSWLDALADDVAQCRRRGQDVIIVSSGAIAVGRRHLGLAAGRLKLEEKQAAAATGQIRLAHAYQETLARHQITVAQVLLTLGDTEERRRHLNARSTLATLLKLGTVPVINENDTVATSEIRFGDNDRLAARVAAMISADTLILLSDIDGLYTSDPRKGKDARFVPMVQELTPEIEAMAGDAPPGYSSGGMVTKLAAARVALNGGCRMAIANGTRMNPLRAIA
ncbi:MAG TPA: glutamate 5-kinase, partial [Dongiaceae bacterium]